MSIHVKELTRMISELEDQISELEKKVNIIKILVKDCEMTNTFQKIKMDEFVCDTEKNVQIFSCKQTDNFIFIELFDHFMHFKLSFYNNNSYKSSIDNKFC